MIATRPLLDWHLRFNHYPPLPVRLIPACEAAIDAAREDDYERVIEMPEGLTRRGDPVLTATAREIVEGCHLEAFVDYSDTDDDALDVFGPDGPDFVVVLA